VGRRGGGTRKGAENNSRTHNEFSEKDIYRVYKRDQVWVRSSGHNEANNTRFFSFKNLKNNVRHNMHQDFNICL
jgi:hypothetical protein